ncbi:MAG: HAD family phosphatase [Dictyoglomaceae bacterium]|nr:HAD family phosphatase [Dictyoglomaceae bacterium]
MKISLVIFDMDGLMFHTEKLGLISWKKGGEALGYNLTDEIILETIGVNIVETERIHRKYFGEDYPFEEIKRIRMDYAKNYIEKYGVPVKEGLYELLNLLEEKGLLKAVATSTERERTEYLLLKAGIKEKFNLIVCGDEITRSKPDPEIFLYTAKKLNCKPSECLVLEDSEKGILSAKRAGMIPILIPDLKRPSPEIVKLSYKVFNSLLEVKDYIEKIL